ncbi:hypothetical protein PENTCL1PPCAC_20584, partial [Pristionchus entomophagus]
MSETVSVEFYRLNFLKMKEELSSLMRVCNTSFDHNTSLIFTMAELLYKAIDTVQHGKHFKPSSTLMQAMFGVIDKHPTQRQPHEVILLKFARAFALFMDSLDGYGMCANQHEITFMPGRKTGSTMKARKADSGVFVTDEKRARLSPSSARRLLQEKTGPKPRPITLKPGSTIPPPIRPCTLESQSPEPCEMPMTNKEIPRNLQRRVDHFEEEEAVITSTAEIKAKEENDMASTGKLTNGAGMSSTRVIYSVPSCSKDAIKEEEIDDYERPVKREIKEEDPLEPPIVDTISFSANDSPLRNAVANGKLYQASAAGNLCANGEETTPCPFCAQAMPVSKFGVYDNKRDWMQFVSKCPEPECDFRSVNATEVYNHRMILHDKTYEGWKRRPVRFTFSPPLPCPFCPDYIHSLAHFNKHVEEQH